MLETSGSTMTSYDWTYTYSKSYREEEWLFVLLLLLRLTSSKGISLAVTDFGERCRLGGMIFVESSDDSESEMTKSDSCVWDNGISTGSVSIGKLILLGPATCEFPDGRRVAEEGLLDDFPAAAMMR